MHVLKPHPVSDSVRSALNGCPAIGDVRDLRSGVLRVDTRFRFPDGHMVSIYLRPESDSAPLFNGQALPGTRYRLTDYGETLAWFGDEGISVGSGARLDALRELVDLHGIGREGTELYVEGKVVSEIPAAIFQLAHACSQVSALAFMASKRKGSSFGDTISEWLRAAGCQFERNIEQKGQFGDVLVDFYFPVRKLVMMEVHGTAAKAKSTSAAFAFSRLVDLERSPQSAITVVDTSKDGLTDADMQRMRAVSDVFLDTEFQAKVLPALI